ncbi:MAG: hypothetical protein E7534_02810 [Ruminococcaceae bacterium]|nr:hypothetical protein [Oscillospiraceae bacterium]
MKAPLGQAIAFEYLDLSISDREEFGAKNPIVLPNVSTRSFLVGVSHVGFADGTVWTGDCADWKTDLDMAKILAIETTYKNALTLYQSDRIEDVANAKEVFSSIPQAEKDVSEELAFCAEKIARLQAEQAQKRMRNKARNKIIAILASTPVILTLIGYFVAYPLFSCMSGDYTVYIDMYNVENFKIPDGVTSIDGWAFWHCCDLKSVTIPNSVTSIGDFAFDCCEGLKSITIPDSVTSIGYGAFSNCWRLKSINIPDGVTSIGNLAFYNCPSVQSITIPRSVTSIGDLAFAYNSDRETVTFLGTKEQWQAIDKGEDIGIYDDEIHFQPE